MRAIPDAYYSYEAVQNRRQFVLEIIKGIYSRIFYVNRVTLIEILKQSV